MENEGEEATNMEEGGEIIKDLDIMKKEEVIEEDMVDAEEEEGNTSIIVMDIWMRESKMQANQVGTKSKRKNIANKEERDPCKEADTEEATEATMKEITEKGTTTMKMRAIFIVEESRKDIEGIRKKKPWLQKAKKISNKIQNQTKL